MTLVDSNVLLDVATNDPAWAEWSLKALEAASLQGPLLINMVVYAELAVRYEKIDDLEDFLARADVKLVEMPKSSLFLAAKVFGAYRKSGGLKTNVLPDFFIGAHAATLGVPLVTRDLRRYRTYFPGLRLIAPTTA